MNFQLFSAFLLITVVLFLTPGPIVTLVVSTGASRGTRAALGVVAGSSCGNAILIAAIACGLSFVVRNAAVLFEVMRWAGVAYLIWLGVQAWRHADRTANASPPARGVYFTRGFLTAVTNPKTIAFFTAFLPQFLDPALPVERQLVVMSAVSVLLGAMIDSGWAAAAGWGRSWFLAPARARLLERISALALIGGGIWLSFARRPA
jgi:threonine/homoserine/homoserine lactone efflux protein